MFPRRTGLVDSPAPGLALRGIMSIDTVIAGSCRPPGWPPRPVVASLAVLFATIIGAAVNAERNTVHSTAVLGAGVELGQGNVIGPYAVLLGPCRIGDGNWIGPHAVIGTPGEIRGIDHGDLGVGDGLAGGASDVGTGLTIGHRNVIREHAVIHQGHYATTSIGDDCYLMNRVYIGHDGQVADAVTMAAGVTLGGHVHVGAGANLGMGAVVHQRRVIGPGAMVGMSAVITVDVAPFAMVYGNPARLRGVNRVGLLRNGVDAHAVDALDQLYKSGTAPRDAPPGLPADAWQWWARESIHRA